MNSLKSFDMHVYKTGHHLVKATDVLCADAALSANAVHKA